MKISRNSLHYRLASKYGRLLTNEDKTMSCDYFAHVFVGCVTAVLMTFGLASIICVMSIPIFYGILTLLYGDVMSLYETQLVLLVSIAYCIIGVISSFWKKKKKKKIENTILENMKCKVCFPIEIE